MGGEHRGTGNSDSNSPPRSDPERLGLKCGAHLAPTSSSRMICIAGITEFNAYDAPLWGIGMRLVAIAGLDVTGMSPTQVCWWRGARCPMPSQQQPLIAKGRRTWSHPMFSPMEATRGSDAPLRGFERTQSDPWRLLRRPRRHWTPALEPWPAGCVLTFVAQETESSEEIRRVTRSDFQCS